MNCPYCGTPKFRTSRVRLVDIPRLALLQYPVRCKLCRERFHVGLGLALHLFRSQRARAHEEAAERQERYQTKEKSRTAI